MKFLAASAATLQLSSWSLEDFEASEASLWWGRLKWNCRWFSWTAAGWTIEAKQVLLYLILEKVFPLWPWTVQAGFPALRIFSLTAHGSTTAWKTNNERAKLNHSLTTLGTMSLFPAEEMLPKAEKLKFPDTSNAEITDITKNAIRSLNFESFSSRFRLEW